MSGDTGEAIPTAYGFTLHESKLIIRPNPNIVSLMAASVILGEKDDDL
jgi:hypothetical protein